MPQLEAERDTLRLDLKAEQQARTEAAQQAAVLEAKLDAARDRALQAEAFSTELKASVASRDVIRRDHSRLDDADRRRKSAPNS